MKYNGKELIEMTPDNWDGKSRRMVAWNDDDKTWSALICGYNPLSKSWICADSSICFSHCADMEIQEEESDTQKKEIVTEYSLNDCINSLKCHFKSKNEDSPDDEIEFPSLKESYESIITYLDELKSLKEDRVEPTPFEDVLLTRIKVLKEENEELKAKIAPLRSERVKMADSVSSAVWKEMMERAEKLGPLICVQMPKGLGFNDISDIVLNKILEYKPENDELYKSENTQRGMIYRAFAEWLSHGDFGFNGISDISVNNILNYKPETKPRRMTNHELAEWLSKGNGQFKHGKFKNGNYESIRTELVYCNSEENAIVDNDCLIRGWNETEWHEPVIGE